MNHIKETTGILALLSALVVTTTTFADIGQQQQQQLAFAKKVQSIQVPSSLPTQFSKLVGSPGVISGNVIQVPIHVPIN